MAALVLVAGVAFIARPDQVLGLRSLYATRSALLTVAVIRAAIGVVLIMAAPKSRAPKMLQVAGALMLFAGMMTPLFGVERTKAVLAWEAAQGPALIRAVGAGVLAIGGFFVFALKTK